MVSRQAVFDALGRCYDPCCRERGISVVDMGLIEEVRVDGARVEIDMVLTTGWCPSVAGFDRMMTDEIGGLAGVDDVAVSVVFDPVWTMERLSDEARAKLEMDLTPLIPYREERLRMEVRR